MPSWHSQCQAWRQQPFVALDTEFMRVDTFYPIAGLLQASTGEGAWLIDPLCIDDWTPLAALLDDRGVTKVLHACSEDLEVLLRLTGSLPAPLFDTQLAAAYLNLGFSMGYSRLVQAVLGLELPKGETRSDWLQRPLSETQVSYAAEDVQHLAEVYQAQLPRLSAQKTAWRARGRRRTDQTTCAAKCRPARGLARGQAGLETQSPATGRAARAVCLARARSARP